MSTAILTSHRRGCRVMRPLIVGGGVAGTVAALALQKAGFEPTVFEAYEDSAGLAHGVYLTVAVNGLDALRAVDADHVARAAGFPTARMHFFSGTGKRLGSMPLGPVRADATVAHTVRRADLYHGLYREAVSRGIPFLHGKRLAGADLLPNGGVRARFDDGTTSDGDILIGADGVHSMTRRVIDPDSPSPRYAGLGNTGGFTRLADVDAQPGEYAMVWGRHCFFGYTVAPDGEIWWFANPPRPDEPAREELRRMTTDRLRTDLIEMLRVDRTPAARIVASTPHDFRMTNQYDLPTVPRWHNGTMILIGDAAHAVSPSSGQGASLAAEDAVVLAQCVRDARTVPEAFDAYERLRRPRVERVVRWGASTNATKKQGVTARLLRDLVLPVFLKRADHPKQLAKMSWLFDHHVEWASGAPAGDRQPGAAA